MQSGISEIVPAVLPYPKLLSLEEAPSIRDTLCYIIKHYGKDGISILIKRVPKKDEVIVLFGDWAGNKLDLHCQDVTPHYAIIDSFISTKLNKLITLMGTINLQQAQFFFGIEENRMVMSDIQLSLNKFAGPGMVRDLFGKLCDTQQVQKVEVFDKNVEEAVMQGTGSYSGDLIIKPSLFKMHHDPINNSYQPLYVQIVR